MIPKYLVVAALVGLTFTASSQAALVSFQSGANLTGAASPLTGNVTTEIWNNLTTGRINNNPVTAGDNNTRPYGWHSLAAAWNSSLVSNAGANAGSSSLFKTGGYGYIASASLHQGVGSAAIGPGGTFTVSSTAITGLETVIFQISGTNRDDAFFTSQPTLTVNGNTLAADFSALFNRVDNFVTGGFGNQDLDSYAFQWDLSDLDLVGGESIVITWAGLANSGIYELQVNQGSSFVEVVPEPSVALLSGLAGLALLRRRRA